jgi:hypothetical protein
MTDWKAQTAKELISQMKNEVLRMRNLKMPHTLPAWIITKDLYDKLNIAAELEGNF